MDLTSKMKVIRNYGQSERYHHPIVGMNSRLDELQAAILSERLKWLDKFTARRREIASHYYAGIDNPHVRLLKKVSDPAEHVYHLFVVKTPKRAALEAHLSKASIQTHIHYPIPVHLQKSVPDIKVDFAGLINAEKFANECISLPIHPMLSDQEVSRVIEAVNSFR